MLIQESYLNDAPWLELYSVHPTGPRPWGRPRSCWTDCISQLDCTHLDILQEELEALSLIYMQLLICLMLAFVLMAEGSKQV